MAPASHVAKDGLVGQQLEMWPLMVLCSCVGYFKGGEVGVGGCGNTLIEAGWEGDRKFPVGWSTGKGDNI